MDFIKLYLRGMLFILIVIKLYKLVLDYFKESVVFH